MNINFIIAGWHFNQDSLINGLHQLEQTNDNINVFWACHREPTDEIKSKFKHEVFFNGGEECGAYDQALEHLSSTFKDDDVMFFLHDDIIVKDWEFINICLDRLNSGYKVIGNGMDYPDNFDPFKVPKLGITEEFDGKPCKDYVKPENQYLFDKMMSILKVRPSFICMKYSDVKLMGGFEPRKEAYIPPIVGVDEWSPEGGPHYRGSKGLSSFGNIFPALVCYKMNKVFKHSEFSFLSQTYVDSEYLYECQRGGVTEVHPMS